MSSRPSPLSATTQVTIRWQSAQTPQLVTGIIVIEVVKNADKKASQKWLIKTVYSEFNSGTFHPSALHRSVLSKL